MNLEIFSDLICPWCFIGKRRLDLALAAGNGGSHDDINVIWRAFSLYPELPPEGMARDAFLKWRFGENRGGKGRELIEAEAQRVGISLDYSRIERVPNTLKGHRLLHRARKFGVQHDLADALFRSYFEQGEDIGETSVLVELAQDVGMDRQETARYLASDEGSAEVAAEMERAANIGISGVPCFIFAGAYALPGAQEPEVIAQIIERVRTKLSQAV